MSAILDVILGGIVGTIVMQSMMMMGSKMGMMPSEWNMINDGMIPMVEKMGMPPMAAWVVHLGIGFLIHPLVFTFVWFPLLPLGSVWISAIIYAVIFGIVMSLMLPMLEAPEDWRSKMSMGIIGGHILYGLSLALFCTISIFG